MDESDEDIDPLVGPVADLMAEHNLSSTTTTNIKKPDEFIEILDQKIKILDYLSFLNIHSHFKDIFNYILDIQWYHSMKIEQEILLNPSQMYSSLKKLSLLFIVCIFLSHFILLNFSPVFRSIQFSLHHFHLHFIVYSFSIFYIFSSLIFFIHFISIIIGFNV